MTSELPMLDVIKSLRPFRSLQHRRHQPALALCSGGEEGAWAGNALLIFSGGVLGIFLGSLTRLFLLNVKDSRAGDSHDKSKPCISKSKLRHLPFLGSTACPLQKVGINVRLLADAWLPPHQNKKQTALTTSGLGDGRTA